MRINSDRAAERFAVDPVPGTRRRGISFANGPALQGIAEYRAFEWPRGSGETWRIAPVGYKVAARLAELEIEQLELAVAFGASRSRAGDGGTDPGVIVPVTRQWVNWCARSASFMGPHMIPTWPRRRRWGYKLLRALRLLHLRRNPLRDAPQNDLAELLRFFSLCRTNSGTGIRPVPSPN
jgi:hypothetical protein